MDKIVSGFLCIFTSFYSYELAVFLLGCIVLWQVGKWLYLGYRRLQLARQRQQLIKVRINDQNKVMAALDLTIKESTQVKKIKA